MVAAWHPIGARAKEPAAPFSQQIWLSPGLYSRHFDRDKGLRDANPGLGVEIAFAPDHAVMVGTYINSNDARSRYAAYAWRPLHWQVAGLDLGAGVIFAAFDGYPNYRDGGWFVAPLPLVSLEGRRLGVNLSLIPTLPGRTDGALAFQFKLRLN